MDRAAVAILAQSGSGVMGGKTRGGVTGRGVLGVASQSLPSVRQLSGAATGVFSGEGKGGTGGGLTVFVGVGTGAFAGLGLDGGFVGLASEVGVTGASGAGALEAAQPMLFGAAGKCLGVLPPRARQRGLVWSGTSVLWGVARRSYACAIQSKQLKLFLVVLCAS